MTRPSRRPHVLCIRSQHASAGATGCAPLHGAGWDADADAEAMGAIYRALRDRFGDAVELDVVDTRNTTYLIPALVRAGRRGGASWPQALRRAADTVGEFRVVVDDRVVVRGRPASIDEAIAQVVAVLDEAMS